jgi:hypothetical protein
MKYIKLFESFVNENKQKQIEKAADKWWKSRMKGNKTWDSYDMDMFIDHLMDEELVDADDEEELYDVRSDMEQYVENTLEYEFNEE